VTDLVLFVLIFLGAGGAVLGGNLLLGRMVRPNKPSPEKGTIYECGEPTIGSAWIQFDLRFYVVALLFVIFDVELAFFFPWAVVFGTANRGADASQPVEVRKDATETLQPAGFKPAMQPAPTKETAPPADTGAMKDLAWLAFADIMVFFAVLLVGFAYLWRRGDLAWVRSTAAQETTTSPSPVG
jgi:NADH-quinone oxidoreductase subunit A